LLLSDRSSIAYTANRLIRERKGLSVPKFGRFPTLDATRIPVSRSNGQGSG